MRFAHLDDIVTRLVNAPSENPVIEPGPDGRRPAHHGGFHAAI